MWVTNSNIIFFIKTYFPFDFFYFDHNSKNNDKSVFINLKVNRRPRATFFFLNKQRITRV